VDLRFINDEFSWRYRNRLTIERSFKARSFEFSPYVRAEVYYDHKVTKWSRTTFGGGVTIPFRKHYEIEAYYEHQNDTSKSPNRQVNALGSASTSTSSRIRLSPRLFRLAAAKPSLLPRCNKAGSRT
jgi:hypothetical protein